MVALRNSQHPAMSSSRTRQYHLGQQAPEENQNAPPHSPRFHSKFQTERRSSQRNLSMDDLHCLINSPSRVPTTATTTAVIALGLNCVFVGIPSMCHVVEKW